MTTATIQAEDICKSYGANDTRIDVLKCLSCQIQPGELTLCVGPSGSGKSTLIAVLSGLLRPEAGRVTVLGRDLWSLTEGARDRFRLGYCGFVFQGCNLFAGLSAVENVIVPLRFMGVGRAEARRRALAVLNELGLGTRAHLRPGALSGGENQRAAIARAIVKEPQLIFADEPTSALDNHNGQIVIDILRHYAHTRGATIIAATHDPRLLSHADRIIHLEDGLILKDYRRAQDDRLPPAVLKNQSHDPV